MRVDLHELGFRYGDGPWLFRDVSCRLVPGESYALAGPSGSGKSTLLALLAGWLVPTLGQVQRPGIARVGWVFQHPVGTPRRTAVDHVALPLLARGARPARALDEAADLLARFGLAGVVDREFRALSGGEAQRVMFARAVAADPDLLLLDEPTAQLDRETSTSINATIDSLRSSGRVVVVATHDPDTQERCTERIDLSDESPRPS
ncbi:MAG: ATP-binding cassette domain-containing protein [Salana multivorans]|uniref:ABC transporter ATP-binding protein n=1 Tax=Salana multivorans TaxID=120377 RepID=UPI000961502C|nr:ATP-binding cassette domain-containing protein [Salana multivorans]MBN8882012.1 ATP-binding cassette domain-containing protein [Salana multivorans]OJX94702.1 MAG: ABC transporter [Micrococcales bacterium 73-15]